MYNIKRHLFHNLCRKTLPILEGLSGFKIVSDTNDNLHHQLIVLHHLSFVDSLSHQYLTKTEKITNKMVLYSDLISTQASST